MTMKVKPVGKSHSPAYPTERQAALDTGLLGPLPKRWRHSRAVLGGMAALALLSAAGCSQSQPDSSPDGTYLTAPIFEHGGGSGALGCDVAVPPVFLSETEALAIIREEAAKVGLLFKDKPPKAVVSMPLHEGETYGGTKTYVQYGDDIGLDAYNAEKGIGLAFVSQGESKATYTTEDGGSFTSSLVQCNMKQRAEDALQGWSQMEGNGIIAAFYDPECSSRELYRRYEEEYRDSVVDWNEKSEQDEEYRLFHPEPTFPQDAYEREVRELSEDNLRAQVRDFIEWLQGQGVI